MYLNEAKKKCVALSLYYIDGGKLLLAHYKIVYILTANKTKYKPFIYQIIQFIRENLHEKSIFSQIRKCTFLYKVFVDSLALPISISSKNMFN